MIDRQVKYIVYKPIECEDYVLPVQSPFPKMGPGIVYAPYIPITIKESYWDWFKRKIYELFKNS